MRPVRLPFTVAMSLALALALVGSALAQETDGFPPTRLTPADILGPSTSAVPGGEIRLRLTSEMSAARRPDAVRRDQAGQTSSRSGNIRKGALIGLAAGAGGGLLYGAAGHPGLPHPPGSEIPDEAFYTLLFGGIGAAVGAMIGGR